MEQLKGLDSLFIHHETPNAPLHVLAVMDVDRTKSKHEISAETFQHLVSSRIEKFDALCKRIVQPPIPLAPPLWLRTKPDLRIHIREITLGVDSSFDNFSEFISEYMSISLDRNRPLWEFLIVHEKHNNISHLIAKGHHALLDGIAGFELMANITQGDYTFVVSDAIQSQYPELVKLVLGSQSLDNTQKQYWFDILPSMSDDQIDRLFDILDTEKRKLEELDAKYEEEVREINEKHFIEWQTLKAKEQKETIQNQEKNDKQASGDAAEDAINLLNNL